MQKEINEVTEVEEIVTKPKTKKKLSKKQKIFISVIAIIIALLAAFFIFKKTTPFGEPTLFISSESTSFGKEGYFTVSAENFDQDVSAFDITLTFDTDSIEIIEITKGDIDAELAVSRELYANTEGKITALYLDYTGGDESIDPDGALFYVRYKTKKPGTSTVDFSEVNIVEPNGTIKDNIIRKGGSIEIK